MISTFNPILCQRPHTWSVHESLTFPQYWKSLTWVIKWFPKRYNRQVYFKNSVLLLCEDLFGAKRALICRLFSHFALILHGRLCVCLLGKDLLLMHGVINNKPPVSDKIFMSFMCPASWNLGIRNNICIFEGDDWGIGFVEIENESKHSGVNQRDQTITSQAQKRWHKNKRSSQMQHQFYLLWNWRLVWFRCIPM